MMCTLCSVNLIGNAILALFDHPEHFAKVRADLRLVPNLVEENLLRQFPRR
jgi:cytochrome P450